MIDIHFKDAHTEFIHSLQHKYLFIIGDSATGKTTFVELVRLAASESTLCLGYNKVVALAGTDVEIEGLKYSSGNVYVIDEENPFWKRSDFLAVLNESNNYFIMMFRDLPKFSNSLQVGLDDICVIQQDNSTYHFIPIATRRSFDTIGDAVICEDSKSGKQFLEKIFPNLNVVSSNGKSRMGIIMRKLHKRTYTLVFDRAGISYDYFDLLLYCKIKNINVVSEIDWDSFETYILHSPEYKTEFEEYPNAEIAAFHVMQELFSGYDKSKIPDSLNIPIYWKVQDMLDLSQKDIALSPMKF